MWHVYFNFPYMAELGSGFDTLAEAIKAIESESISKWNIEIVSDSFGIGGRHIVVWNLNRRQWVNKRTGNTIEQEGWV